MPCMRARPGWGDDESAWKSPEKARLRRWVGALFLGHLPLMQSSTRVMRPVATRTLILLVRVDGLLVLGGLLCDVGGCIDDRLVSDEEMAWRDPAARPVIGINLVGAPYLGGDVCHGLFVAVPDKVIRNSPKVLFEDSLPGIRMAPPLKGIVNAVLVLVPRHIHSSVIAELEFDGAGRDKHGRRR